MSDEDWRDIPELQVLRSLLSYAPVVAVIVVIVVAVGLDLKFGGPGKPEIANSAPPADSVRATIEALPTSSTPIAPQPTATVPAVATTVAGPDSAERDQTRMGDLMKTVAALQQYHQQNGEYPSTGGNIQTLCTYQDIDAGCKLKSLLDPIPQDPLGSSVINGYWYVSDGTSYAVMAGLESPSTSPSKCDADWLKHTNKPNLFCVTSP